MAMFRCGGGSGFDPEKGKIAILKSGSASMTRGSSIPTSPIASTVATATYTGSYAIVANGSSSQSSYNRTKIFVNGAEVTAFNNATATRIVTVNKGDLIGVAPVTNGGSGDSMSVNYVYYEIQKK